MKPPHLSILAFLALAATAVAQLIPTPQVDRDLAAIDRSIAGNVFYLSQAVQSFNATHSAVWSLPDERLSAVLNKLGGERVTQLVTLQSAAATALNTLMDSAQFTGPRAIVEPSREFVIAQDGTITVVPLPEPPAHVE